jgi:hypothetical protein
MRKIIFRIIAAYRSWSLDRKDESTREAKQTACWDTRQMLVW